jgi:hypothetical protein
MAILVDAVRAERCIVRPSPSVREVCLVGVSRPGSGWGRGDRVLFSGRVYRVKATRARSGREDEAPLYVHLSGDEETD